MSFSNDERPQIIVEYALILILIIIVLMVIGRLFGPAIIDFVDTLRQTPTPSPEYPTIEGLSIIMKGLI